MQPQTTNGKRSFADKCPKRSLGTRTKGALLLLLLFSIASLSAAGPFDFGLSGRIAITKATFCMDGNSIQVFLRDERGAVVQAIYRNHWPEKNEDDGYDGGQIFYVGVAGKVTRFRRNGVDEKSFLEILRAACVTAFGTSDPQELEKAGSWDRMAMSSLFQQASSRHALKNSK